MSWLDRYSQNLKITTGDNKTFELFTLPSFTKEVEYNGTEFSFVEKDGQLIKKRKLLGRAFPLEFYFVGENNIEDAKLFEVSAQNPSPWLIEHPYYDNILAQVLSIKFDDSDLNVTKVTCTAKETMSDDGLVLKSNPIDVIQLKKVELDDLIAAEPVLDVEFVDIDTIQSTTEQNYNEGLKIISLPEEAEAYFNAFNEAISAVNVITASPILAMQALINVLSMPATFEANVQDRIRVLGTQFDNLRRTIEGLTRVSSKALYLAQGAEILSDLCLAAVNPLVNNYRNASVALTISKTITDKYALFLEDLDELQNANGGNPLNFIPSFNITTSLRDLVVLTTSSLFEIALAGRKEMSHVLSEDSNVILLTHRFYKLDLNDNNISEFIENNALNYREIALGVAKGKTVVYYA